MGSIAEDIEKNSEWLVKAFAEDQMNLDYSISSLIEIDRFFNKHTVNGVPVKGGRLSQNVGFVLFSVGAYVGSCLVKNVNESRWVTVDKDPNGEMFVSVLFPDGGSVWPMQRVLKRFKMGSEESIYVYGHMLTKEFTKEEFDSSYWKLKETTGKWWKFW